MVELMETHKKWPNKCHPKLKSQNNEVTMVKKLNPEKTSETLRNLRPAAGKNYCSSHSAAFYIQ